MKISSVLLSEDFPIKYFYCSIDDKEYILSGDKSGIIFDTILSCDVGNIIIEILENKDFIYSITTQYIDKITSENYCNDEIHNQDIIWAYLIQLQKELEESNIKFFSFIDIPSIISKKFVDNFIKFSIEKEKYSNDIENYNLLKELLDIDNIEQNKNTLNFLRKLNNKKKEKLHALKDMKFKDFVLQELNDFLNDFKLFSFNLMLYVFKDVPMDITNKLTGEKYCNTTNTLMKIRLLQQNLNFDMFSNFYEVQCFSKIAVIENDKLCIDVSMEELEDKSNFDIKIIEVFKFNNLIELLNLSLTKIFIKDIIIKKCNNCNNYFIPESRSDEKYCNRKSPQNSNKTCKEYGSKKTYREEVKSTPIKYEHNKTSQFYRMRINRCKNQKEKEKYEKYFNKYKESYQKKKTQYNSGKLKEIDFIEWIKQQKDISNENSN